MIQDGFKIGVTGHRELPEAKLQAITKSIRDFFVKASEYDDITVLSSLAEGADMLCARLALDAGFRLVVPLPMSVREYRKDFSKRAAVEFDRLLSQASEAFPVLPLEIRPEQAPRGFYYRQAALYVTALCDILLAVWDGVERDTPDGAGTWETVKQARELGKKVVTAEW